jgi:hypothetical protein
VHRHRSRHEPTPSLANVCLSRGTALSCARTSPLFRAPTPSHSRSTRHDRTPSTHCDALRARISVLAHHPRRLAFCIAPPTVSFRRRSGLVQLRVSRADRSPTRYLLSVAHETLTVSQAGPGTFSWFCFGCCTGHRLPAFAEASSCRFLIASGHGRGLRVSGEPKGFRAQLAASCRGAPIRSVVSSGWHATLASKRALPRSRCGQSALGSSATW